MTSGLYIGNTNISVFGVYQETNSTAYIGETQFFPNLIVA